jgi:MoaA/NifB/PqqE/SkfB family radical SAM enzyme
VLPSPPTTADPLPGIRRIGKLYLELLFRCNFACQTCFHGTDLARPDTVTTEQAERALAYFADRYGCAHVCLLGGEPLLHPGLPEILVAGKRLGYRTEICTNGYKRRRHLIACLPHLDLLRVSLDGTAEVHDDIRRPGSFTAALEAAGLVTRAGVPFSATCTITGQNAATIPELAVRLRDLGARDLTLHRVRPVGNAAVSSVRGVTWEQAANLHRQLQVIDLGEMQVNLGILLPERCPPPADIIEKLEIAPDGRVYTSCDQVAGPGTPTIRYDFDRGALRWPGAAA